MIIWPMITATAAALITLLSILLVLHCDYEDGLFGRMFLAAIGTACFVVAWDYFWVGNRVEYFPCTSTLIMGLAGFLARHTYRFLRAVRCPEEYGWRRRHMVKGEK